MPGSGLVFFRLNFVTLGWALNLLASVIPSVNGEHSKMAWREVVHFLSPSQAPISNPFWGALATFPSAVGWVSWVDTEVCLGKILPSRPVTWGGCVRRAVGVGV